MARRDDLSTPRQPRRIGIHYDRDAFGEFSESIARFFGTARFLVIQTGIVIVWISVNIVWGLNIGDIRHGSFDPYPFILLNLAFSTQAAYAAPLILLAQSRQERRDRVQTDIDRRVAERTQMDTEFLAREIAGVRLALADVPTAGDLGDQLDRLTRAVQQLSERLDAIEPPPA
jgi:uncharacterized membrane protein